MNKTVKNNVKQLGLKTALSWLCYLTHAYQTQNIQLSTYNN